MGWLSTIKAVRKRKAKKAKRLRFTKHIAKHPKYYNKDNSIAWRSFCLIFTFYMLFILLHSGKQNNATS